MFEQFSSLMNQIVKNNKDTRFKLNLPQKIPISLIANVLKSRNK